MSILFATTLLGLLSLQATAPPASEQPAGKAAPVQLAPVPDAHFCAMFDEGEMRARLLDPNLANRENAYVQLVQLGARHRAIYATISAWAQDEASLELAWTARLALRELNREFQRQASSSQFTRPNVPSARPWQEDYQRQLLQQLGLDPAEFRVRFMRLSPDEAVQFGVDMNGVPITGSPIRSPHPNSAALADQPLGVVCNEQVYDRVVLTRVIPGSIADSIGLLAGDRLLSIGGVNLGGPADISEAMHRWNSRPEDPSAMLEVVAIDGKDGSQKVGVWNPRPAGGR